MHYRFAHRALRKLAAKDPARFASLAARGDLANALTMAWDAMNSAFPAEDRVHVTGLAAHYSDDGNGRAIVVVTMPPPEHSAEAYFVALVIEGDAVARYITLEHGWNVDDSARTVLGEWTEQGHVNLGDGPPPAREMFERAVRTLLEHTTAPE